MVRCPLALGRVVGMAFAFAFAFTFTVAAAHAESSLGKIDFPVTAPTDAVRQHFLRGMLAMHSFWYEEAREEFRAATAAAPAFAMGYWGEAMTNFHPVWAEEDVAASRAVMARLPANVQVSDKERGFLDAARLLFGDGDRPLRWQRYSEAMGALHERWAADDEVATLYAVALLGVANGSRYLDDKDPSFRPFARAAAIALDVFARNPDHPGAAHYIIHAFDDPEHAILALPAARRYAQIAPEASHARHMPSHIFVQLGMWPEALASNESAWAASDAWVKRKKLDASYHDHHSLMWLLAVRLERGERAEAREVLGRARADLDATRDSRPFLRRFYAQMVATYLAETDEWERTDELLVPIAKPDTPTAAAASEKSEATCHPLARRSAHANVIEAGIRTWIHALRALAGRQAAAAEADAQSLARTVASVQADERDSWRALELEVRGRAAGLRGDAKTAIARLEEAAALDEKLPPSGPVFGVTPRERLGDLYLAGHERELGRAAYRRVLELHPGRARALAALRQP